jgi:iron complex outermembrane receptor protein
MAFASVTHGYKGPQIVFNPPNLVPSVGGGGVTLPGPPSISVVQPESPMDEEVGLKATVLDGHLAVDANLFHTIIKDFQAESFKAQGFVPANISHVITQGAELDVFGFITKGLMIHGGASFDRDTYPHGYLTGCSQVGPHCPSTSDNEDVGGTQLIASPRFKVTLTPQYEYGVLPWMNAFGSVDAVYKTDMHFEASTDVRDHTGCHTVIGARLGLRDPDDKWSVAVYGRNLLNAYNPAFLYSPYLLASATAPGVDTVGQAISTESYRFIGFSVEGRF